MAIKDLEKTNELLDGLKDENVTVENVDKYLQQQGVLVDVHVGRLRNKVDITPGMLGVDKDTTEELSTFFNEYVKTGKICFIPMSYEKKFQSIETSLREKKREMAIGYDNKYMPIQTYKEYKIYMENKKAEYLNLKDEVLENWDSLIYSFKTTLENSLNEMNALDRVKITQKIFEKIPSKDTYGESFYVSTSLKAFPVMTNIDLFDESLNDELRESIQKQSVNSVYEILSNILSDAFSSVNKILVYYNKNRRLTEKQLTILRDLIPRISSKNIFKNVLVDEIIQDLNNIRSLSDFDDMAECCESVLARIYSFAKDIEVDVELDLSNSILSVDELEILAC